MATTPPLRATLHAPHTPLHGPKYDSYQPYSTRRSTRQSNQRAIQTPPPQSPPSDLLPKSSKESRTRSIAHTYSPPSSPQTSPQKKLFNTGRSKGGAMGGLFQASDPSHGIKAASSSHQGSSTMGVGMLPTPAKTPRKKQVQNKTGVGRVLFPVHPESIEEAMPTPRKNKRNKRHVGFSLDSDAESEGGIQIFTDSQDKIPEFDLSEENPFIDHPLKRDPPEVSRKSKSKKRKAESESISKDAIKESFDHERGMVYVFRGRKIYKPFPRESPPPAESLTSSTTHFTRSSAKPRLLFPTAQQQRERQLADEEATTEIEASNDSDMTDVATEETEVEEQGARVVTPEKSRFMPDTPPTTGHATRAATKKAVEASPSNPGATHLEIKKKGGKRSPFDGWARRKSGASSSSAATGKGRKRQGEVMEKGDDSDGGVPINGAGKKKIKATTSSS